MKRLLVVTALLLVATPAVAEAKTYKGKTSQKYFVEVKTGADGVVKKAGIGWRAPCGQGRVYGGTTGFRAPIDVATTDAIQDSGTYRKRTKGGYRARITGTFSGQRDPATDRWTGTWAVKVMVTRKGKVVDRCALKRVTWKAK